MRNQRRHVNALYNWTICGLCGKRAYPSERAARAAMRASGQRAGVRVYRCGARWHLTSSPTRGVA